jgi:hypothetical protein
VIETILFDAMNAIKKLIILRRDAWPNLYEN